MNPLLVALAVVALASASGVVAKSDPPSSPAPPSSPLGNAFEKCSDTDAAACSGGAVFKCGEPELASLVCPGGSAPCRVTMSDRDPAAGTGLCDGDLVSVSMASDGAISSSDAPGALSGPVRATSQNNKGFCTATGKIVKPPANCGNSGKLCPTSHVDFCYCSGRSGAPLLSLSSLPDRDALPCAALALERVSAANTCGQSLPVTVTIVDPAGNVAKTVGILGTGGLAEIPAGAFPGCGEHHVYFTAINPRNARSSQVGFVARVGDEVVLAQDPRPTGGAAVCGKTWRTKCGGGGAKAVAPSGLAMDGCALTASFPAQVDACGVAHPIADETVAIGSCGVSRR